MTSDNQTAYEKFVEAFELRNDAHRANEAKTSDGRSEARNYAVQYQRWKYRTNPTSPLVQPQALTDLRNSDQGVIDDHNTEALRVFDELHNIRFNSKTLDNVVGSMPEDLLAKRVAFVPPAKIKANDSHNKIVDAHLRHALYEGEKRGDEEAVNRVTMEARREYIKEDVAKTLRGNKNLGLPNKMIEMMGNAAASLYDRLKIMPNPKDLKEYVESGAKRAEDEFNRMFANNDERVKYASDNLKVYVANALKAGGEDAEKAAGLVYSLGRPEN